LPATSEKDAVQKLDLKKQYKHLYQPPANEVAVVEVPELPFAMLDGRIAPGETPSTSATFEDAVGALYGISYTLKFISTKRETDPVDYGVMPLEGLWWADSGEFDPERSEPWNYTLLILQPDHVDEALFEEARRQLQKKKPHPLLERLRLERFCEGLSMQTTHVGPYADEPPTLARMRAFAEANGYAYRGKHHEIYLGDPRRAAPEKLRTVLRQPVER
jgi:hypothetical protein